MIASDGERLVVTDDVMWWTYNYFDDYFQTTAKTLDEVDVTTLGYVVPRWGSTCGGITNAMRDRAV